MSTIVLNKESRQMPLGQLLDTASGSVELLDERGTLVATLVLEPDDQSNRRAMNLTSDELAELRASRALPRSGDVTTAELMERLRRLGETTP